jgi:hypothetical protein
LIDPKSFSDAIWSGDLAAVEAMLAAGADPNAADDERPPPLSLAIEQMEIEIVGRLIVAGADIHRDGGGWTPLAHSIDIESDSVSQKYNDISRATTALTELLLAAGARPTPRAFKIARDYRNSKALALLERFAAS